MKKFLIVLFLILSTKLFSQYSGITYFYKERSFMVSAENMDGKGFGIHAGGGYNMWLVTTPISYMNPSPYLNRFGVNYGFLHSGLVLGGGIKFNTLSYLQKNIYPEFWLKLQPLKLITKQRNFWDVSVTCAVSNQTFIGFGVAIPMNYRFNQLY
jgi:hypothetical protein